MTTETDTTETFDPDVHASENNDGVTPKYNKSGGLMRKRGRKPGATAGGFTAPAPAPAPRASTSSKRAPTDYRPGLYGITQLVAAALVMVSPIDAVTVTHYTPPVIEALQVTSESEPRLAAVLDKIMTVGPWGLVISACVPLIAQVAANHRLIPVTVATGMGAMDPVDLAASAGLSTGGA